MAHLAGGGRFLSKDGDWSLLGAILSQEMPALAQRVLVGHIVEGPHVFAFQLALSYRHEGDLN